MPRKKRPEEQMYKEFCREFVLRFRKFIPYLFRIDHGGYKIGYAEKTTRKETLLKPGIPDYAFFYRAGVHTMLWIEFKVKGNTMTVPQKEVRDTLVSQSCKHVLCYSAEDGIEEIRKYLNC